MAKRLVALILMLVMVFVPVLTVSAAQGALASTGSDGAFVPRLKAPSYSNKYYYSELNILHRVGYGMPNCTAYAWGRAYEIMGYAPDLSLNDADTWWDYNKENHSYNYGQKPKLGAVACWEYTTGGGHVAVVEQIKNGEITYSNSAYGGEEFYLTYADVDASNGGIYNSTWIFKGYIYITEGQSKEEYYQSLGGDVYTVDSDDGINLRKGAGTSYKTLTAIPDKTQIVVTETKKADGYLWGKTSYDGFKGWCVLDFTDLVYKQPEPEKPSKPAPVVPKPEETVPEETVPEETVPEVIMPEETLPATFDELPSFGATADEATKDEATRDEATADEPEADNNEQENFIMGDVNGDGRVSITDATLLQKHLAKVDKISEKNIGLADFNGDGKISVADVTAIQKKLAGILRKYI